MECNSCKAELDPEVPVCLKCGEPAPKQPNVEGETGKRDVAGGCLFMVLSVVILIGSFIIAVDQYFRSGMTSANGILFVGGLLALISFIYGIIRISNKK